MLKPRLLKQQAAVSISDLSCRVLRCVCDIHVWSLSSNLFRWGGLHFVILVTYNFVLCVVIHSDGILCVVIRSDGIFTCVVSSQIDIVLDNYCEVEVMGTLCELGP